METRKLTHLDAAVSRRTLLRGLGAGAAAALLAGGLPRISRAAGNFMPGPGAGVIYAINEANDLLWYRHEGRDDGTFRWTSNDPRKVGTGWNFQQVFAVLPPTQL